MAKKSNWFDTVFLPSLFEYAGVCKEKTISEKQLQVIENQRGIEYHELRTQNSFGQYYVFGTRISYQWNGRKISVYPQNNGKAKIYFGMNETEEKEFQKRLKRENWYRECDDVRWMKNHKPEEYKEKFKKALNDLWICVNCFDACAASENDKELHYAMIDLELSESRFYKYYFA